MNFDELDFENRVLLPSKTLYSQTGARLTELYAHIKALLSDWYEHCSQALLQLYREPEPTLQLWYRQSETYAENSYNQFNKVWWPEIRLEYDNFVSLGGIYVDNLQKSASAVLDNPGQNLDLLADVSLETLNKGWSLLSALATVGLEAIKLFFDRLWEILLNLIDDPLPKLESYLFSLLDGVLEGYYQIISSLLMV